MNRSAQALKSEIRARVRAQLRGIDAEERAALSAQACRLLGNQEGWRRARSVLFYSALNDELDLSTLWSQTVAEGKILALPRFDVEQNAYAAGQLPEANPPLERGGFGVLEPGSGFPLVPLNQLDLVLVPGVAFDLCGRRLGRGKGYYDRLLAQVRGTKCGVAFDLQIQAELPMEPHDVVLDCILTPTRWLDLGRRTDLK